MYYGHLSKHYKTWIFSYVGVTIKARNRGMTGKNYTQNISDRDTANGRTHASPRGRLDKVSRNLDPAKGIGSREPIGLNRSH